MRFREVLHFRYLVVLRGKKLVHALHPLATEREQVIARSRVSAPAHEVAPDLSNLRFDSFVSGRAQRLWGRPT